MNNINQTHQRRGRINMIVRALEELKKRPKSFLDDKKFIHEICIEFGVSRRMAKEYLDLAIEEIEYDESDKILEFNKAKEQ